MGVPGQKVIWMWPPWGGAEYTMGEGGGFPRVQAVVNLVCPSCSWLVLAPKVLQLCTNHLVLVWCRSVWVSEACYFFLVPSGALARPSTSIMLRAKERALTPYPSIVFNLGLTFESFKELGVRHFMCMGSVDGRDNPYVFTSKINYYIMGAHLLCKNNISSSLLKLKILNQVPIVHINGFIAH